MAYFALEKEKLFALYPRAVTPPDGYLLEVFRASGDVEIKNVTAIFPHELFVIECEESPRNFPLFGLYWNEITYPTGA